MDRIPQKLSPVRPTIAAIQPNDIGRVAYLALGEPDLLPLWFGETDLKTPDFICDAAKRALDEGYTFYTHARGIAPLREAIREFHRRTLNTEIALERITVPGAAMLSVVLALQTMIETGDNVVCVSPVWPNIFQAAEITGAQVKFCRLTEDWTGARWILDLEKLFETCDARTKAIFIASPGNPTGWIMSRDDQRAVLEFCRARGIAVISDEVYGTLVYDGPPHAPSFLQVAEPDDAVFVINSFSKPWAMTGWRIGWLTHPAYLSDQMNVLAMANNTGATTFAQWGAVAALSPRGDEFRAFLLQRCRAGFEVTRRFVDSQNRIRWIPPHGAFYGFLHIDGMRDSFSFACDLVHNARVGVAPGSAFAPPDDVLTDSYVRICFAQDADRVQRGLERLSAAVAAL
ncbi:MAG TPA: aminotransferase class I/II-fold pyridoxal phosphate-dependent enzyme [Rhizomicrobium sp.]|jgi:aspartate/methionine/tyrosine aminotransferase|nr:aminotransferase class I/II-fold pyridoxal phosphate-dependent enzyme [Rhizomicrobium sp.]